MELADAPKSELGDPVVIGVASQINDVKRFDVLIDGIDELRRDSRYPFVVDIWDGVRIGMLKDFVS